MATKTATINVRTNAAMKKAAAKVFEKVGLDLSTGVNMYLTRVAQDKAVPFQLRAADMASNCAACMRLKTTKGATR